MLNYKKKISIRPIFFLLALLPVGSILDCTTAYVAEQVRYQKLGTAEPKTPIALNNLTGTQVYKSDEQKIFVNGQGEQKTSPFNAPAITKKFEKPDNPATAQAYVFKTDKERQSLAGVWQFKYLPAVQSNTDIQFYKTAYDTTGWQEITVPGHWELQGVTNPGFKEAQPGIGFYRTTFNIPAERLTSNTFLVFEGVFNTYQVWLNGEQIGEWDSPNNRAMFNISRYLKAGPNLLAVKVSARTIGPNLDAYENWALAGIFRDVYLYSVPGVYVQDLNLKTDLENQKQANLQIRLDLASTNTNLDWGRLKVNGALYDASGKLVQKFDLNNRVDNVEVTKREQKLPDIAVPPGTPGQPGPGGQGSGSSVDGKTAGSGSSESGNLTPPAAQPAVVSPEESVPIGLNGGVIELAQANFPGIKAGRLTGLLKITDPQLWTAETPYLYTLSLTVKYDNKVMQESSEKVGLRQVKVENGILLLNGQPIKLRGINWFELYPDTGKALTEQQLLNDLQLLKAAHINFIRTTYCPPQPRFFELTDEWGFYVMCDLPLGIGDAKAFADPKNTQVYTSQLGKRVSATIRRDRNRASLLIWGMGYEQELNPMLIELGRYVKELDSTRLICYPERNISLAEQNTLLPDYVDLLAAHYPRVTTIKEQINQGFTRPLIYTAYAEALGLAADRMTSLWEQMYKNPTISGGAIWRFADLGLKRQSAEKVDTAKSTQTVWLDANSYYDHQGLVGVDGIVYADRIPQSDYWQCQAAYNQIRILDNKLTVKTGSQELAINIENRHDFLDLSALKQRWELYEDRNILQKGELGLACPPHQACEAKLTLDIPGDPALKIYWLKLLFSDAQDQPVCEQVIRCLPPGGKMLLEKRLSKLITPARVNMVQNGNGTSTVNIDANGGYRLFFDQAAGTVKLQSKSGLAFIKDGPYPRVGRRLNLAEQTVVNRQKMEIWSPSLLQNPFIVLAKEMTQNKAEVRIRTDYWYERPDAPAGGLGQSLEGGTRFVARSSGMIEVLFNYKTNNATGTLLDAGASFILPDNLTEFYWIGRGPYPSYPGQEDLFNFGFFHQNINDISFQGNRSLVLFAALTDGQGNGIALLGDWGAINLSLEKSDAGLVLSYNAFLSGRGNREQEPEVEVKANQVGWISGEFKVLPFNSKVWKQCFSAWFGESDSKATPFHPYYHSYDQ